MTAQKAPALFHDACEKDVWVLSHLQAVSYLRKSVYPRLSEQLAIEPLELDLLVSQFSL